MVECDPESGTVCFTRRTIHLQPRSRRLLLCTIYRNRARTSPGNVRIVESRTGAVAWALCGNAPFPVPAHQTGRADFPHPAFRLASPRGTWRRAEMNAAQPKHAKFTKHHLIAEAAGAARQHLMTPNQEAPDALGDVVVDRPMAIRRVP